ncbi:MAG: bifunctional (p)ppGpp synthetase/guanosine-3',5'-bis(diphosphate) 3'-pyrophosphohydrolase [Firmicutes bacterium]|nr:bifunctional (p)ppGpp synthetase/guanosine-3',5'-bis(diphosphate) 3'-pyrophosphohydrolase [Bacillota bacterium]
METRDQFLGSLSEMNPKYNMELIARAFDLANEKHKDQKRKSGEPYIIHPMAVAKILADLGMDEETVAAGLLHDVVEDTDYTYDQLKDDFGEEIALLVDGVTKLTSMVIESKEQKQAENLRKMFLAMSKDIRVLIIKLADRLHNLRTINYMTEAQIHDKCTETLEIYAPLAERLGIYAMKFELEDIALKHIDPEAYQTLRSQINKKKEDREAIINKVIDEVKIALDDLNIHYDIMGRSKHFYSIYRKMKFQNKQLDEIFDLMAVRVLVDTVKDCYAVLGIVHTMWKPIPGKFKDYIAMPKPNMYQSLHTTVLGDNGEPFEIQIRTYEMHRIAEYGIAAHWKYKEGVSSDKEEIKLAWLRQTLEWQKDMNDPKEFMDTLKVDLFASQVFVFTPQGEVMELPAGSTPIDFAFKIHSAVGYKCVGAKVNGKIVPIDYKLQNGNIVEIITSANSGGPSVDWLKIAQTSSARSKIRQWLKKESKDDKVDKGREAIEKYVTKKGYDPQTTLKSNYVTKVVKQLGLSSADEMYLQLASGGSFLSKVAIMFFELYHADKQEERKKNESALEAIEQHEKALKEREKRQDNLRTKAHEQSGILIKGSEHLDNLMIRISKCCNPVPGDSIVGFITKGRGISVHRADCVNVINATDADKARFIDVEWNDEKVGKDYEVTISVIADDRKGLFSDISKVCDDNDVNLTGINAKTLKDGSVVIAMTIALKGTSQMEKILRSMRSIPNVSDVYRGKL